MHRHLQPLLEGSPWAERLYFWPPRDRSSSAKQARRALIQTLRTQQFDLAITLPNSFRSAFICWRAGAKRRVGFNRDGRGLLLTDRLSPPNKASNTSPKKAPAPAFKGHAKKFHPMPLVDYYAYLAGALGCEHPGDALRLFTTPKDDEVVNERLAHTDVDNAAPLVVICPGANFGASKCWPPERFAAVADRLVAQHNCTIAISPGPGEEPLAEAIHTAMQQPSELLVEPCLTLGELKSLIQRSALLLGNDTGPRHFARAFDINRVTVFGPTEVRWTDTSHDRETIVRIDVPCGPCHLKVCPLPEQVCMQGVTVDMVTNACVHELANRSAAS
jgi:heptosyltransferase-2